MAETKLGILPFLCCGEIVKNSIGTTVRTRNTAQSVEWNMYVEWSQYVSNFANLALTLKVIST